MSNEVYIACPTLGGGGSERDALVLAAALRARGHAPSLLVLRNEGALSKKTPPGVKVLELKCSRVLFSLLPVLRFMWENPRSRVLVLDFDMAIIFGLIKRLSSPDFHLIYRESNMPMYYIPKNRRWLFGTFINAATSVIAQNRSELLELRRLGITSEIIVANNPTLFPQERPIFKGPCSPRALQLLSVGRLDAQKSHVTAIRAIPRILEHFPEAHLTILGEGALRGSLQQEIDALGLSGHITLAGFSDEPNAWRRRTDVFIMTSEFEGQPNALLESIAAGCRYLATPCGGGVAELLHEIGAQDALISHERFSEEIVEKLTRTLSRDAAYWEGAYERFRRLMCFDSAVETYARSIFSNAETQSAL